MKPEMSVVLSWSNNEFDRLWTLALSGHLKFAHFYFTAPRYGSGLVVTASLSNEREERDQSTSVQSVERRYDCGGLIAGLCETRGSVAASTASGNHRLHADQATRGDDRP